MVSDVDAIFKAKDVDVHLRPLFNALTVEGQAPDIAEKRVLVVDDIFATGSSLVSVRRILENDLGATIAAVFFLSGV